MAAVTGLSIVKRFPYRGDPLEEFSNTYHFKGQPPGDDASWRVLANDVWNVEKLHFPTNVLFVRAYGYDSDDPNAHHVFQLDNTIPGPPPGGTYAGTGSGFAGDQAACMWWKTNRLSSRGKPIYLRKYVHSGFASAANHDDLEAGYMAQLDSDAQGLNTIHGGLRSPRTDDTVVAHGVIPYVTTRTLKRRGKRPTTGN